jgi:hypothetical protein
MSRRGSGDGDPLHAVGSVERRQSANRGGPGEGAVGGHGVDAKIPREPVERGKDGDMAARIDRECGERPKISLKRRAL